MFVNRAFPWLVVLLPAVFILTASTNAADIKVDGDRLTVTTRTLEAEFHGGDIVRLVNRLDNSPVCSSNDDTDHLLDLRMLKQSNEHLLCRGWSITEGGAEAIFADSRRTVRLAVHADDTTGEIAAHLSGSSSDPGVMGVKWGIQGLDLSKGRLVLPAYGGSVADEKSCPASLAIRYTTSWEAQMLVWEGNTGGVMVYSPDDKARFKTLHLSRERTVLSLGFETEAVAPFAQATDTPELEWRIAAFQGDWRKPADDYRKLMRKLWPPAPHDGGRAWAHDIRTVVNLHSLPVTDAMLNKLAKKLNPRKTLLYLPSWRRDGYDVNYPDYTPFDYIGPFMKRARALGFRIMLHADLPGVSPGNPAYKRLQQYQVKESTSLEPLGWYWDQDESVPQRFAFINPAAGEFRKTLIDGLRIAVDLLHPDAIHLDVSGTAWNDGNGLVEGRNYIQGSVELHRELLAAFPGIVLGGEGMFELLAPYESFAQRWKNDTLPPHPISAFLFEDMVFPYGYLGQPGPEEPGYLDYFRRYELQAVPPTVVVGTIDDLNEDKPGMRRLLKIARAWQTYDLWPNWDFDSKQASLRYTGPKGAVVTLERTDHGVRCCRNGKTLYERITSLNRIATAGRIPGWLAYDDVSAYGLDPTREYWLDFDAPARDGVRLSYVSSGAVLTSCQATDRFGLFELTGARNPVIDLLAALPNARQGTVFDGKEHRIGRGSTAHLQDAIAGGVQRSALFQHPPYQSGVVGETFVEYRITIPTNEPELAFSFGLADTARESDGVTFRITVDGKEVWRRHTADRKWQPSRVDLSPFAGNDILLRLITDPGPQGNTAWDHAFWSDARIVAKAPPQEASAKVVFPKRIRPKFAGAIQPSSVANGVAAFDRIELPNHIVAVLGRGDKIELPQDLLSLPFDCSLAGEGISRTGSVYGSGRLGRPTCGGVTKAAISAHTPAYGQTVLSWVVDLPAEARFLSFSAGLADGSCSQGIGFSVRINGEEVWAWETKQSLWQDGRVDISRCGGQTALIQLVSDAQGDNNCDWGQWADVRISAD